MRPATVIVIGVLLMIILVAAVMQFVVLAR